ncbi:MAG: DUF2806 domain-containing protein [Chloroflexi bacterium]|nr:DUF2806 domain-containing protein [Chloroflexota bacterium]
MNDEEQLMPMMDGVLTPDILDSVTGVPIPPQIKRNAFKALMHLGSNLLRGMRQPSSEQRALHDANALLTRTAAERIAEQMEVPSEYVDWAGEAFGRKILREQARLDSIASKTLEEIIATLDFGDSSGVQDSSQAIDDDWLNAFEAEGRQKSSEEMRNAFAKMLAGEIREPGSFSIRAVKALSSLDQATAKLFRRACSLAIAPGSYHRVTRVFISGLGKDIGSDGLDNHGFGFGALLRLSEHGLVVPEHNLTWSIEISKVRQTAGSVLTGALVVHQGSRWWISPNQNNKQPNRIELSGVVVFTDIGRELFTVVNIENVPKYTEELMVFLDTKDYLLTRLDP